jgi:hypothetical protein
MNLKSEESEHEATNALLVDYENNNRRKLPSELSDKLVLKLKVADGKSPHGSLTHRSENDLSVGNIT